MGIQSVQELIGVRFTVTCTSYFINVTESESIERIVTGEDVRTAADRLVYLKS